MTPSWKTIHSVHGILARKLDTYGVANKLLITFLFGDRDVDVQFLKDVGLIQNRIVCCKWGSQMPWSIDTKRKGGWFRKITFPHALLLCQSGMVQGFGRVIAILRRYCSSRKTSFPSFLTIQQQHLFGSELTLPRRHVAKLLRVSTLNTSVPNACGWRITSDDVAGSFVVLCAPRAANRTN
jgi:hypothetical protein